MALHRGSPGDQGAVKDGAGGRKAGRVELAELEVGKFGPGRTGQHRGRLHRSLRVGGPAPEGGGTTGCHQGCGTRIVPSSVITRQRLPSLIRATAEVLPDLDPTLSATIWGRAGDFATGLAAAGVDDPAVAVAAPPWRARGFLQARGQSSCRAGPDHRRCPDPHRPAPAMTGRDSVRPSSCPRNADPASRRVECWRRARLGVEAGASASGLRETSRPNCPPRRRRVPPRARPRHRRRRSGRRSEILLFELSGNRPFRRVRI